MEKIYKIDEIKEKLHPVFSAAPVYRAVLFGSYAKGLATGRSDVDIVIDSRGELININFYGLLGGVTDALNKDIDMFEVSEIRDGSRISNDIKNEGIVLYERP